MLALPSVLHRGAMLSGLVARVGKPVASVRPSCDDARRIRWTRRKRRFVDALHGAVRIRLVDMRLTAVPWNAAALPPPRRRVPPAPESLPHGRLRTQATPDAERVAALSTRPFLLASDCRVCIAPTMRGDPV
jgi:hypothetical protein